ncbi:DUF4080 domain-containing protein [Methylomonas sp. MED-D]|uniref:B12-binding domain-containing radical SAM protein n=1 Tax=unclassified Methylomonas TaxID=2608980 RepID=UPI0028A48AB6|nr:DUF4080 domain-containing protein [Methylomonas sp. MV1]MDT4331377.1 DUF4080 domain-containing protein [Methylomonas sp. MV1]
MTEIVLCTLNARYIHSAFGLRYLYANMAELRERTQIAEFGLQQRPAEIVERLLDRRPRIIGFGVYIWNVAEIGAVLAILKQVAPDITIVLGGPEVSHPPDLPACAELADYIVTGPGERSFPALCRQLLAGVRPEPRIVAGPTPALAELASPYPYYSDSDLRQRLTYVEASRGCPFKCEFCLSALDVTAKPFPLAAFLSELDALYQRGGRHFKFIDRTFNLRIDNSVAILEFFLDRLGDGLQVHFEVIPDHLPERLREAIRRFPPGVLQFEVGVQSFDPDVQQRISRRQDNAATATNLSWLREHTHVHIHADLIFGLPGDTLANFGASFDHLYALGPQEIQVGILKRLRGAPINRHDDAYRMRYDPNPPYSVLATRDIGFSEIQRMQRFARYWDMIGNSGRFTTSLPLLCGDRPFERFLDFSDALYAGAGSTWQIALKRLYELSYGIMTERLRIPAAPAAAALAADYRRSGEKGRPAFEAGASPAPAKRPQTGKRQRQAICD